MTDTASADRGNHHALVIGIDDYPYVHANPLRGCRNDAETMAGLLAAGFGFRVRLLPDREATRGGILQAMADLLGLARPEDRVVVHFSGHGSRIKAPDGRYVESFLPHDSGRGQYPNRDVTDQELYRWLLRLSAVTPYVTLIFDSCHAGGIVRDLEATARGVEPDERPASLSDKTTFQNGGISRGGERDPGPSGWLPLSDRYTLIAACRAGERARELEHPATGQIHGALTCLLADELARREGELSYRDVFERVALRLNARFREQNPQLEGAWDRELFGTRRLRPMRFVPVRGRRGPRIELAAGAVHGLVRGSEWRVYPHRTRRTAQADPLGRLRIESVQALRAEGELIDEVSPGAVEAGGRAVEVARPPQVRRLAVRLPGTCEEMGELAQRVGKSLLLDQAPEGERCDFAVHCLAPRQSVQDATPVPQLGSLGVAAWAVTDGSGRLVMPPKLVSSPVAVDHLVANLETLARYRALAELRHPDPEHPLGGVVKIELLRRRPPDRWHPAEPESDGRIVYQEGDLLALRLRHHHEDPLYVAVLDLGLTGAIRLLHPVRGSAQVLPPWRDLEIGLSAAEELELYVPEELPYTGETFRQGLETLVFLATTAEADLGLLTQEGVRERLTGAAAGPQPAPARAEGGPLATLLHLAFHGIPERDARAPVSPASADLWTVTARSIWLRRR